MTELLRPLVVMVGVIWVGAVFLFLGYRLVRVTAVVVLASAGAVAGEYVSGLVHFAHPMAGAAIGAVVLGMLAIPLLKAEVAVSVGALLAAIVWVTWGAVAGKEGQMAQWQWVGALGGFVLGLILAVIFSRFLMIATTSLVGAFLMVWGGASLLRAGLAGGSMLTREAARDASLQVKAVAAAASLAMTLVGIAAQYRGARRVVVKAEPHA